MSVDQNLQEISNINQNAQLIDSNNNLVVEQVNKLYFHSLCLYCISAPFSISLSQTALVLSFICLLLRFYLERKTPTLGNIEKACIAYTLITFLSSFNGLNFFKSLVGLRENLIFLVFFVTFWGNLNCSQKNKLIDLLTISSVICVLLSLIRFSNQSFVNINFSNNGNFRLKGFFSTPITFGNFFSILTIFFVSLLVNYTSYANFLKDKLYKKYIVIIATILCTIAVILSQTRGSWVAIIAGFGILIILNFDKRLLFSLSLIFLIFILFFQTKLLEIRLSKAHILFEAYYRFTIWYIGYEIFDRYPFCGISKKSIKYRYLQTLDLYGLDHKFFHGHLHQNHLEILAANGYLGLATFIWFILEIYKMCIKYPFIYSNVSIFCKKMASSYSAVFTCFLATGITECSWFDEEVSMLALFLTGLILSPCHCKDHTS